jgi:gluconokinase
VIVIVLGVVGAGKTTVGSLLAQELGWQFSDADDYHSVANKQKIHRGIPLTDADREPWLECLHQQIANWISSGKNVVLACSALKRRYREELQVEPDVKFVYLKGDAALIDSRLQARRGHFADDKILGSQLADLEEPEDAVTVVIDQTPPQIVAAIRQKLGLA